MGFLDNSGDIILDAVLTDTGRKRLARGDGSFKVAKFALGDEEINYGLYNKNHASGSAYYDLEILQTPVLEAFTNNTSTMKSKLITISRTNVLYLPIVKLNESLAGATRNTTSGSYYLIAVDENSRNQLIETDSLGTSGVIDGYEPDNSSAVVVFDQGLDTSEISKDRAIDPDLIETQYVIQMDHRLGRLTSPEGVQQAHSFIDDDNIATYYVTTTSDLVSTLNEGQSDSNLLGPRGTRLSFKIRSSQELETSVFMFNQIGLSSNIKYGASATNYQAIDTNIRIMGGTTGYSLDLPVRYLKKV